MPLCKAHFCVLWLPSVDAVHKCPFLHSLVFLSSRVHVLRVRFLANSQSVSSPGMTPALLAHDATTGSVLCPLCVTLAHSPHGSPGSGRLPDILCSFLLPPSALCAPCFFPVCLASHSTPILTPTLPFTYALIAPCPPIPILMFK